MRAGDIADTGGRGSSGGGEPLQGVIAWSSGLLVSFVAFGFASWFSGAASWVGFYLGARGQTLVGLAQVTSGVGFAIAVVAALVWYRRRCAHGQTDIPQRAALAACLILPLGNIFWAIFVDAIAYHYGQDIVRPAFDDAIMYVVLGSLLPLCVGVPWLVLHLRRRAAAPRTA
jgi:hypothetical protein